MMLQRSRMLEQEADNLEFGERGSDDTVYQPPPIIHQPREVTTKQEPVESVEPAPLVNIGSSVAKIKSDQEMVCMENDIRKLIEHIAVCDNLTVDQNVFESKIFQEAEQLLSNNSQFSQLISSAFENVNIDYGKFPKIRKIEHEPEKQPEPEDEPEPEDDDDDEDVPMNLTVDKKRETQQMVSTKLMMNPACTLTSEEVSWTEKMHQNIAKIFQLVIRPEFYTNVMDLQLGNINKLQFLMELGKTQNLQTYVHVTIMTSLPYFHSISSE